MVKKSKSNTKASQQLALTASGGCNEGTPACSLEFDLPRTRGALGECGGAGKSGTAKDDRKRPFIKLTKSTSHGRGCFTGGGVEVKGLKEPFAKKRNSQSTDPTTFDENSQGGAFSTPEASRDPKTVEENGQGGDLRTLEPNFREGTRKP